MLTDGQDPKAALSMRPALITPVRLFCGIAAFAMLCMLAVAAVTDYLADTYLVRGSATPSSRVHLIHEVVQALSRAQDCRRAYLVTGDSSYLSAYRAASADVDSSMDRLVSEDNQISSKLAHADELKELVHTKLSQIGVALESNSTKIAATPDPDLARIERLLSSLAQEESRDASGGLQEAQSRSAFHRNLLISIASINFLFLAGMAFCAFQISKLHSLITLCAWSKRVQYKDQWIPLEEYMRKRFGIRISHGISQEEYDKWSVPEMDGVPGEEPAPSAPSNSRPPKAA
jgi:CHASE3 domain sensor protein